MTIITNVVPASRNGTRKKDEESLTRFFTGEREKERKRERDFCDCDCDLLPGVVITQWRNVQ